MNRPGCWQATRRTRARPACVPSFGPHMRPALMLMAQGCDPAVREMKSTASSSRTESPKLASPPVSRSARWTKIRSASGATPARPARLPVAGRDVQGPGAVRCPGPGVRDGGVVAQPLVRPRIGQRAVDLGPAVHGAVPVRLGPRAGRLVALVPEGQQTGAAGRCSGRVPQGRVPPSRAATGTRPNPRPRPSRRRPPPRPRRSARAPGRAGRRPGADPALPGRRGPARRRRARIRG